MTALGLGERTPMPVKESREDLCFYLVLLQLLIPLFVARVVFAIGINFGDENDILSIRRPDRTIRARRDVRHLVRLADQRSVLGIKVAHPDLRRIGRFRSPDQAFAIWRKSRPLFMIQRFAQSL